MTVIDMFRQIYGFCRKLLCIFNFIGTFAGVLTYRNRKMEMMNEKGNSIMKESKIVFYLVVAAKIIFYLLLMMGFAVLFMIGVEGIQAFFPVLKTGIWDDILLQSCLLAGTFLAAFLLLKKWDHLPFADLGLSIRGKAKDIFRGALVALIIYAVGFGILCGVGEITIVSVHFNVYDLLVTWFLMVLVAITEEVAFRGFVLGRLLNAGINRFVALLLSSALFSVMHIFNANFSFISFVNIMLAGVLIGSTYIYTRNLWFPISLHLFWNWFQGPILGFGVSGGQFGNSLLTLKYSEENIINGGAFGFESSILCTALMIIAIVILLKSASRQSSSGPYPHSAPALGHADE